MPKTVATCKFSGSSRDPSVVSCSSDVQNCDEMQIFLSTVQPSVRAGRTSETLVKWCFLYAAGCRGRRALDSYIFARRCSETHILKFWHAVGSIVRNCGEMPILSSWNCSAHGINPGRVNDCVVEACSVKFGGSLA